MQALLQRLSSVAPSIQTDDFSAELQGQTQEGSGTMAHYVVADIHGEADRFHAMLEKIRFSDEDMLYILGGAIDRGPDGIKLLQKIMHTPNMVMLRDNNESMVPDCLMAYVGYVFKTYCLA